MTTTKPGTGRAPPRAIPLPPTPEARFQRVYEENYRLVFRSVSRRIGNHEDAEDLTADVFLKAACSIDYERPPVVIQQWLFKITQTTLVDFWRARTRVTVYSLEELLTSGENAGAEDEPCFRHTTRHDELQRLLHSRLTVDPWLHRPPSEDGGDTAEFAAGEESAAERVARLLGGLPASYRDVLTCRFLLNLTIRETALRLGLSEANVKVTQFRALKRAAKLAPSISDD